MTDPGGSDDRPTMKSSEDMLREAREAWSTSPPDTGATGSPATDSPEWLEADAPDRDPVDPMPTTEEWLDAREPQHEGRRRSPAAEGFETPTGFRPRPSRARTPIPSSPTPPMPIPGERQARARRRILGLAGVVALIALAGNLAVLLIDGEDSSGGPAVDEIVVRSTGPIDRLVDPCSFAVIAGSAEAVITYLPDPDAPVMELEAAGTGLQGSDGSEYTLEMEGATVGAPGQVVYTFPSDRMTVTRHDGLVWEDLATIFVQVGDGVPTWSARSLGGGCPG